MNHYPDISNEELSEVIKIVKFDYGYDFTNYARASFMRRVNKFMKDNRISSVPMLKQFLHQDKESYKSFLHTVTVNVTEMFRDPIVYKTLKEKILPILASYPNIKIWHAGCSTGEEVFSTTILLEEAGLLGRTLIYATDINAANIEKAKTGMIPLAKMKDYTANYIRSGGAHEFSDYYTARYNHALIRSDLRKQVVFFQHNLVTDQAFNEFHLVICRNVLIYFNRELQNRIIDLFYESMPSLGYLSLGIKESLAFSPIAVKFETIDMETKLFRKKR